MQNSRYLLGLIITCVILLSGCGGRDQPLIVARQYCSALARGDGAQIFALFSSKTQNELARRAQIASHASAGAIPNDPRLMIIQGDLDIPMPTDPRVISVSGDQAKVEVKIDESTHEIFLVRQGQEWRIDLRLSSNYSN